VLLAFDWFQIPPTHEFEIPDAANLGDLVVYLGIATLIGILAAHAGWRAHASEQARSELAGEQAALRRVATLVAERAEPEDVCAAVAREIGQLLDVDLVYMGRYDEDTVTAVASWSRAGEELPVGMRTGVAGHGVSDLVRRTARPARIDNHDAAADSSAELLRKDGVRSSVGAPIIVDGALWGVMIASTRGRGAAPGGDGVADRRLH
jgi:transcriptional regulator with GAF, ATPase, and Fis domain